MDDNDDAGGKSMITNEEMERFNDIFPLVRKTVGWSAEEFGDKIGVTRQTISNLETKKIKISKTTYIAMRFVLDEEMEEHPDETDMLKVVLDSFVDNPDKYTDEQREEIRKKADLLASAIKTKTASRKEANNAWKAFLAISVIGGSVMGIISSIVLGAWRNKK